MPDIAFSMTADERDVVRGLNAIGKETGKLREQIADLATLSKQAGAADQQLSQQRLAALAPLVQKQQELKAGQAALVKDLQAGTISADQYQKSFDALAKESNGLRSQLQKLQAQVNEDNADMKRYAAIIKDTESETAGYSRAVAELDHLKAKGIMKEHEYAQALQAVKAKLVDANAATKAASDFKADAAKRTERLKEQIEQLAAATQKSGNTETAVTKDRASALNALIAKQQQLATEIDRVTQEYADGKTTGEQYRKSFDALSEESADLTTQLKKLDAQVNEDNADMKKSAAIIKASESGTERYAKAVAELDRLKAKGTLNSKQHAAAIALEGEKLNDGGKAAGGFGGQLEGLALKMATAVAGFASMQAIIQLIKGEYDALLERQGKSKDANISLAVEQEALIQNLGGEDLGGVVKKIRKSSQDSGVKEADFTRAVNEAMAAKSDMAVSDVLTAVETSAKVRKFAPQELAALSGATLDIQKQTGLNADQSLGFMMQLQSVSRTNTLKSAAENLTPAVGGIMNFGADRETAGSILAALSQGMGDRTGAQSKTSGISLAEQLREFSGGQDISKVIGDLQQNPELRKQFLDKASFEKQALPAIESLLSGGRQAEQYAEAQKTFRTQAPEKALEQAIDQRKKSGAITVAERDMALANVTNQEQLANTSDANKAVNRDRLYEFRQAKGSMYGMATAKQWTEDAITGGGMSSEQTIAAMRSEVEMLRRGKTDHTEVARVTMGASGPMGQLLGALGGNALLNSRTTANALDPETQAKVARLEASIADAERQIQSTGPLPGANNVDRGGNNFDRNRPAAQGDAPVDPLMVRQTVALERIEAQNAQRAHAGIVGNRRHNQGEAAP